MSTRPAERADWARWCGESELTLGVEEEVMLLEPGSWSLHQGADAVLASLDGRLDRGASAETHASALELATGVHSGVAGAVDELAGLRARLAAHLAARDLAAAAAGLHAFTTWHDTVVSRGERFRALRRSLHGLTEREPTFALHVHMAVQDPEEAVAVMNGLRDQLPLLLALGQLPLLAGAGHRHRVHAHPALPGVPPHRSAAGVRRLPRLGRVRGGPRRPGGDPRSHPDLVGRPAPAALRHGRGAGHGRADHGHRHRPW